MGVCILNTIGGRLKYLRRKHKDKYGSHITQSYVAREVLGVEPYILANYESNRANPPYDITEKLSDFYGCSIDYILKGVEFDPKNSQSIDNVIFEFTLSLDGVILTKQEKELFCEVGKAAVKNLRKQKRIITQ